MTALAPVRKKRQNNLTLATATELSGEQHVDVNASDLDKQSDREEFAKADIRLSLGWFYLVIFFGKERRSPERVREERKEHPVLTLKNAPVLIFIWLSVFVVALLASGTQF